MCAQVNEYYGVDHRSGASSAYGDDGSEVVALFDDQRRVGTHHIQCKKKTKNLIVI